MPKEDFNTKKAEYMKEDIEKLLRQRFYGSYVQGPIESAILEKIHKIKKAIAG